VHPMKMQCRVSPSSRRTDQTILRALTSCARCAASIRASPVVCTCTWATARCFSKCTPQRSAWAYRKVDRGGRGLDAHELEAHAARIDALVDEVESWEAPDVRATVTELLQALLQLHGDGLARLLRIIAQRDIGMLDVLTRDTVVAHLLLLHGLHPVPVEKRVVRALEEVRPLLQSHGGNVELLGIEGGGWRGCGCKATVMAAQPRL
jgi:hypothetical protein